MSRIFHRKTYFMDLWNILLNLLVGRFAECAPRHFLLFFFTGVDCSTPKQLHDGTISYDGTGYNMVVEYKCDEGYSLTGSSKQVCQSSGMWSGVEPFCDRKHVIVN